MTFPALSNHPVLDPSSSDRIRGNESAHWELREFLDDEAALLEDERLFDWLDLLTDDLRYWMPVRANVHRSLGQGFSTRMGFFDDTKKSLTMRVQRILNTQSGWTEDPPSRTGRFVTNVRTFRATEPEEFVVESNLLLTRSRIDSPELKLISAKRYDRLRRTSIGLRIAQRDIYINHATLDVQNLAILL